MAELMLRTAKGLKSALMIYGNFNKLIVYYPISQSQAVISSLSNTIVSSRNKDMSLNR